uniref:Uncharacterized protein n=1 Tax=Arundo donax TaxID=35708 RepID=A0A0A9DTL0_ARUDO
MSSRVRGSFSDLRQPVLAAETPSAPTTDPAAVSSSSPAVLRPSPALVRPSMSSSENTSGRTPFGDITNTSSTGVVKNNTNVDLDKTDGHTHLEDAKERKRQRDREHYALKRDEILKKKREACQRKKTKTEITDTSKEMPGVSAIDNDENMSPDESTSWLHVNEAYQGYHNSTSSLIQQASVTNNTNPDQLPSTSSVQCGPESIINHNTAPSSPITGVS